MESHDLVDTELTLTGRLLSDDPSSSINEDCDVVHSDCVSPPPCKRRYIEDVDSTKPLSVKQLLLTIHKSISRQLDCMQNKIDAIEIRTKCMEEKLELFINHIRTCPGLMLQGKNGPVVVGMSQDRVQVLVDTSPGNSNDGSLQNLGANVTLITLNTEDDFPDGVWLGDETNPETRVRVPVCSSDLLHIHSNCRTPEKMALTLLDYIFDRETQANSNLSGLGKHGKKQLDPLMIYGIRCHVMHKFNISESDWHRIKQNIDSKCRTAFRRRARGMPLSVKAFRGKAPPTFMSMNRSYPTLSSSMNDLSASDDSMHNDDNTVHHIQTVGDLHQNLLSSAADIIQESDGQIQVVHATPEQMAQLQRGHHIQILNGNQVMICDALSHSPIDDNIEVAVSLAQASHMNIIKTDDGTSSDEATDHGH